MNKNTHTILYVDDDSANRALVKKILIAEGYNYIEAEDGISGIDIAKQEKPDLILMDMNMPGLDGYEASTRLKALPDFQNTPIIAVTANALPGDKERSLIAGCEGYITKPIDLDTFTDDIESYLGGKKEQVKKEEQDEYLKDYSNKLVERMENKVRALSEALEKSEQANKAKRNFLAIIGHELRTPLHAVINLPEIIKKKFSEDISEKQLSLLDIIVDNGKELLSIIDKIMLYTNLESSSEDVDLSPMIIQNVIENLITKYRGMAKEKGLDFTSQCSEELPIITADNRHLIQVLSMLVDNAIKFTIKGSVTIVCKELNKEHSLLPQNLPEHIDPNKNYIMVCVNDTGIGIAEDKLEHIFDGFSQAEDAYARHYGGIGMGLTIASALIELHHGHLWATSKVDQGSSFCFIIPA